MAYNVTQLRLSLGLDKQAGITKRAIPNPLPFFGRMFGGAAKAVPGLAAKAAPILSQPIVRQAAGRAAVGYGAGTAVQTIRDYNAPPEYGLTGLINGQPKQPAPWYNPFTADRMRAGALGAGIGAASPFVQRGIGSVSNMAGQGGWRGAVGHTMRNAVEPLLGSGQAARALPGAAGAYMDPSWDKNNVGYDDPRRIAASVGAGWLGGRLGPRPLAPGVSGPLPAPNWGSQSYQRALAGHTVGTSADIGSQMFGGPDLNLRYIGAGLGAGGAVPGVKRVIPKGLSNTFGEMPGVWNPAEALSGGSRLAQKAMIRAPAAAIGVGVGTAAITNHVHSELANAIGYKDKDGNPDPGRMMVELPKMMEDARKVLSEAGPQVASLSDPQKLNGVIDQWARSKGIEGGADGIVSMIQQGKAMQGGGGILGTLSGLADKVLGMVMPADMVAGMHPLQKILLIGGGLGLLGGLIGGSGTVSALGGGAMAAGLLPALLGWGAGQGQGQPQDARQPPPAQAAPKPLQSAGTLAAIAPASPFTQYLASNGVDPSKVHILHDGSGTVDFDSQDPQTLSALQQLETDPQRAGQMNSLFDSERQSFPVQLPPQQ